jgi:hypothetical protein
MHNYVFKQFAGSLHRNYETGTIIKVKPDNIYVVQTSKGLQLTLQDISADYKAGDSVLLAETRNKADVFIIKKNSMADPAPVNFIVNNGVG